LAEEFGITQSEIGRLVGKGQSTIANKLRLLRLPESVQARVLEEGVSERHARALLDLPDESLQLAVLREIQDLGLSVRDTEERVKSLRRSGVDAAASEVSATASSGEPGRSGRAAAGGGPARTSRGGGRTGGARGGGSARKRGAARGTELFDLYPGAREADRRDPSARLAQVSDRRAIRVFRDVRLFLNTFRRAVEMLKEAGIGAEMTENDGPEFLEVRVVIPKGGPGGPPVPPGGRG